MLTFKIAAESLLLSKQYSFDITTSAEYALLQKCKARSTGNLQLWSPQAIFGCDPATLVHNDDLNCRVDAAAQAYFADSSQQLVTALYAERDGNCFFKYVRDK